MGTLLKLLERMSTSGTIYSRAGDPIHVNSNGTTTASNAAITKAMHEQFSGMRHELEVAYAHARQQAGK